MINSKHTLMKCKYDTKREEMFEMTQTFHKILVF